MAGYEHVPNFKMKYLFVLCLINTYMKLQNDYKCFVGHYFDYLVDKY